MKLIYYLKNSIVKFLHINYLRFLFIGAINTIFGYFVFYALIYSQFIPEFAILVATLVGLFFNLYTYSNYFFKEKLTKFIFLKFTLNYSIIYFCNIALFNIFILMFDKYISQLFCIPFIVLLNWFSLKYFVYKK